MEAMNWMIKKAGRLRLAPFVLAAVLAGMMPNVKTTVLAAVEPPAGTVTELKQTAAGTNSVSIQFHALVDAEAGYEVRVSSSNAPDAVYSAFTTVMGGNADISGLSAGSSYYVKVCPFYVDDSGEAPVNVYGTESAALEVVTVPGYSPGAVAQTGSGTDSITIEWEAVAGSTGYLIEYCLSDGASPEKAKTSSVSTKVTLSGLSDTKTYTAYVTPYRQSASGFVAYDASMAVSKGNLAIGRRSGGTPYGKVGGFCQKSATADSAGFVFDLLQDNTASYSVQLATSADGTFKECEVVKEGSYTVTGLKGATAYYVRVVPFYENWNSLNQEYDRSYGTASEVFEIVTAPAEHPKSVTQTAATETGISLKWDAVAGASGYYVDYYCSGTTKPKQTYVTKTKITLAKLKKNEEYNVFVTPYKASASGYVAVDKANYVSRYSVPVKPSKAENAQVLKYWQSLGKVNLRTKKIKCADGYQYSVYTAYKQTDTKVATASSTSYASANLKSVKLKENVLFKVRVRAYIKIGEEKVYGKWSDWTYLAAPRKVTLKKDGKGIRASWGKVKGADCYAVYVSTDKNGGYKKCAVTTKKSCTISSCGNKKLKAKTRYYVYVIPQKETDEDELVPIGKKDAISEIKY